MAPRKKPLKLTRFQRVAKALCDHGDRAMKFPGQLEQFSPDPQRAAFEVKLFDAAGVPPGFTRVGRHTANIGSVLGIWGGGIYAFMHPAGMDANAYAHLAYYMFHGSALGGLGGIAATIPATFGMLFYGLGAKIGGLVLRRYAGPAPQNG